MKIIKATVLAGVCATVAACAPGGDAVVAVGVDSSLYAQQDCKILTEKLAEVRQEVAALSKKQDQARNADAVGVFLLAIPTGSLLGLDVEGELAAAKGKLLSIQAAQEYVCSQ